MRKGRFELLVGNAEGVHRLPSTCYVGVIVIAMLALSVPGSLELSQPSSETRINVWSANFETGDNSQFNGGAVKTCVDGTISVSNLSHAGIYSGAYSGRNPLVAVDDSCREYKNENLAVAPYQSFQPIHDFYFEMYVYVPTTTLTDWISFATLGSGDMKPLTINAYPNGEIFLTVSGHPGRAGSIDITQNLGQPVVKIPFGQWFSLSMTAHNVDSNTADLSVSENGVPIIHYVSTGLSAPLAYTHFGLFIGQAQKQSVRVLNDDILIQKIITNFTSTTTVASSSTSTLSGVLFSIRVNVHLLSCRTVTVTLTLTSGTLTIRTQTLQLTCSQTLRSINFNGLAPGIYRVVMTVPGSSTQGKSAIVPPNTSLSFSTT